MHVRFVAILEGSSCNTIEVIHRPKFRNVLFNVMNTPKRAMNYMERIQHIFDAYNAEIMSILIK